MKRNTTDPSENFDFVAEKQFLLNSTDDCLLNTRTPTINSLNTPNYSRESLSRV